MHLINFKEMKRRKAFYYLNLQNYIIYYTKNPDDDLGEWERISVNGDTDETAIKVNDEETPYNIRIQAATKDGVGIISEAYDVTTGKKRRIFLNASLQHFES